MILGGAFHKRQTNAPTFDRRRSAFGIFENTLQLLRRNGIAIVVDRYHQPSPRVGQLDRNCPTRTVIGGVSDQILDGAAHRAITPVADDGGGIDFY